MAKEDKKGKKPKKEKGANSPVSHVTSKETLPVWRDGNVELNGEIVTLNYKKPRSSVWATIDFHRSELHAFAVGSKDDGGYVITDHPNIAAPLVSETLTGYSAQDGWVTGANGNGLDVYINTAKVSPGAIRAD